MKVNEKTEKKDTAALIIRKYQQYLKLEKSLSKNTLDAYMTDLDKLLNFLQSENIGISDVCLDDLERDKSKVYAKAYDMVLNGAELSSGSIRITNPELQKRMFRMLGLSEEEAYKKFGFLTDAFKYGAPPHGGMGIGLDRLVMQM